MLERCVLVGCSNGFLHNETCVAEESRLLICFVGQRFGTCICHHVWSLDCPNILVCHSWSSIISLCNFMHADWSCLIIYVVVGFITFEIHSITQNFLFPSSQNISPLNTFRLILFFEVLILDTKIWHRSLIVRSGSFTLLIDHMMAIFIKLLEYDWRSIILWIVCIRLSGHVMPWCLYIYRWSTKRLSSTIGQNRLLSPSIMVNLWIKSFPLGLRARERVLSSHWIRCNTCFVVLILLSVLILELFCIHHYIKVFTNFLHTLVCPLCQHCFDIKFSIFIPQGVFWLDYFITKFCCSWNQLWIFMFRWVVDILHMIESAIDPLLFACSSWENPRIQTWNILDVFLISPWSNILALMRLSFVFWINNW